MTDNELLEDLIKKTTVPRINFPPFKGQKILSRIQKPCLVSIVIMVFAVLFCLFFSLKYTFDTCLLTIASSFITTIIGNLMSSKQEKFLEYKQSIVELGTKIRRLRTENKPNTKAMESMVEAYNTMYNYLATLSDFTQSQHQILRCIFWSSLMTLIALLIHMFCPIGSFYCTFFEVLAIAGFAVSIIYLVLYGLLSERLKVRN